MPSDLTFITNEQGQNLAKRFASLIKDTEYFDEEVLASIQIGKNLMGDFHFGLVSGQIDGRIVKRQNGECFDFTWDGNDECDSASGSGWIKLKDENHAKGEIKFHLGDDSTFQAKRMKK